MANNKKILFLVLGVVVVVAVVVAIVFGYRAIKNRDLTNQEQAGQQTEVNNGRASDEDKGEIKGKTTEVKVTQDKMTDISITLDKVTVDDKEFGTAFDGTWFITGLSNNNLNESKYIIEDYTVEAKKDIDLKDVNFTIIYEGGETGGGQVSPGAVTPEGAKKFGFYQRGTSLALKAGETKTIKIFTKLNNQVLGADKMYLQVKVGNDVVSIDKNSGKFDITSYVK